MKKYRPYFTPSELSEIIRCLKASSSNITLLRYLETFNIKITRGIISPQITNHPSIEEKLGLTSDMEKTSPNQRRELAYKKWLVNPSECSLSELIDCSEYRYSNNLMTPEEEDRYEKSFA